MPFPKLSNGECDVIWDALHDYGKIEWQRTLADFKKAPNVAYQEVLNKFNSALRSGGGSKALFLTQSNLVISGRLSPKWVLSHDFPSVSRWFSWGDCILVMSCNWIFNLCQQKHNKIITNTKMGTRDEYFNPNFTKLELTWHTREWPNR